MKFRLKGKTMKWPFVSRKKYDLVFSLAAEYAVKNAMMDGIIMQLRGCRCEACAAVRNSDNVVKFPG